MAPTLDHLHQKWMALCGTRQSSDSWRARTAREHVQLGRSVDIIPTSYQRTG